MVQKFSHKNMFYLVLVAACLLLLATMSRPDPAFAQGSNQYVITLRVEQNRDCSVGTYSVETPDGVELDRLIITGARAGDDVQCSLIFQGFAAGLGNEIYYVAGIGAITGPLDLVQVQGKNVGGRIHFKMLSLGRVPPVDAYPIQQQLILYVGN
jgi:hypothetical protein